jgi:hypothetical protein
MLPASFMASATAFMICTAASIFCSCVMVLVGELMASYCGKRGEHGAKGEKLKEEETNSLFSVVLRYEVGFFHFFRG